MFRDPEALMRQFYSSRVDPVRVAARVPNPIPELFVRSWRTGGAALSRVLDNPIITTQVWAPVDADVTASGMAADLRSFLYANATVLIAGCSRVEEVSGLYFDPDPATERPRYTFSSQLWLRATI